MIIPLQYLRGIAAIMVVYHHVAFQLEKAGSHIGLPLAGTGAAGVDIFFVISGFIIWVTTRSPSITPAAFLQRRLIRVVPLYWAVTILLLIIAALAPSVLGTTGFEPEHAILSLLFIPAPHPQLAPEILPYFIQGWTLNYEIVFYGIFTLALAIRRSMTFPIVLGGLGVLAIVGLIWPWTHPALNFYSTTLLVEFAAGMALGVLYLRHSQARRSTALMLIGLGVIMLYCSDVAGVTFGPDGVKPERALLWGLPGVSIVAGTVYLARRSDRSGAGLLWTLGEASYSLYLTHLMTLPAIRLLWPRLGLGFDGAGGAAYVIAAISVSIIVSILVCRNFERPATAFLRNPLSRIRARPASA